MPGYAVESSRQTMLSTGIVRARMEWTETADGARRPSDVQARDEDTGVPLYDFEVLFTQSTFGRESTVTAMVLVPSETEPKPQNLTPVVFDGLMVEVRLNKAKAMVENWTAQGLSDFTPKGQPQPTSTSTTAKPSTEPAGGRKAGDKTGDKAVA